MEAQPFGCAEDHARAVSESRVEAAAMEAQPFGCAESSARKRPLTCYKAGCFERYLPRPGGRAFAMEISRYKTTGDLRTSAPG